MTGRREANTKREEERDYRKTEGLRLKRSSSWNVPISAQFVPFSQNSQSFG